MSIRRRHNEQRSRNGCVNCKRRKIKCDEKSPCTACVKSDTCCKYVRNLLWEDDALKQGISFGRSKTSLLINKQRKGKGRLGQGSKGSGAKLQLTLSELCTGNEYLDIQNNILFLNSSVEDFSGFKQRGIDYKNYHNVMQIYDINFRGTSVTGMEGALESGSALATVTRSEQMPGSDHIPYVYGSKHQTVYDEDFGGVVSLTDVSDVIVNGGVLGDNGLGVNEDMLPLTPDFFRTHLDPSPSPSLSIIPHIPFNSATVDKEMMVYDYMVNKIFPNCICYGGELKSSENPYLNYLVPLSVKSSIFFKVLIFYSSKVYGTLHNDKSYEEISANYKAQVLDDLPRLIEQKSKINYDWEEILGTILILCSSNISSDCDYQWIVHSKGGKKILSNLSTNQILSDPFKKFFIRFLVSHDIFRDSAKVSKSAKITELTNDKASPQNHPQEDQEDEDDVHLEAFKNDFDEDIDLVLGCSPNLLRIINETTKLGDIYESIEFETEENISKLTSLIMSKKNGLLNQLNHLNQSFKSNDFNSIGIRMIAEIKRLTAKIYLFARIDLVELKYKSATSNPQSKLGELNDLIQKTIDQIKLIDYTSMALTWPLFVIGVLGDLDESTRYFILNRFNEMEGLRRLASIKLARKTVERVWKQRDLEQRLYTWNDLVIFNSETISLA